MPDLVTVAEELGFSQVGSTLIGTIAVVDMVGYATIAKMLEENAGTASVAKLNRQIQAFVTESLGDLQESRAAQVIAKTGDGAIVFFQRAEDAHQFGRRLHLAAHAHSGRRSEATAERWFRIGIAAGEVNVTSKPGSQPDYAGMAIANAVRLEGSATAGEIVMDAYAYADLSSETQKLYGAEELVHGKRDETFQARKYRVTQRATQVKRLGQSWKIPRSLVAAFSVIVLLLICARMVPAIAERIRGMLFSSREKHIAVLPLDMAGGTPDTRALGDGLMDSLSGKLSNLDPANKSLFVVPASEVRSRKVINAAAAWREFGATIVIKGRFERNQQEVRLGLTVIDPRKDRDIGYFEVDNETGDLAALQDEAVARLGRLMNIPGKDEEQREGDRPVAAAAYTHYLAGLGYFARSDEPGNIDLAIDALQEAVTTDSSFALAFARLAQVYAMKFRLTSAPEWLRRAEHCGNQALRLDPQLPSVHVALGQIHELEGEHEQAIQEFNEAIKLDPRDPDAISEIAGSYQAAGRTADAEAQYKKAAEQRPDAWKGYNDLGNFYEDIGRPKDAIVQYNRALQLAPGNSWVDTNLGIANLDFDDPAMLDKAESALKESIAKDPTYVALLALSFLYAERQQFEESLAASQQAVQLNDKSYSTWYGLSKAYDWLGENTKGDQARRKAVDIAESVAGGQLERISGACPEKMDQRTADAEATLASLYAKLGETDKTREILTCLRGVNALGRYAFLQLADAYELLGQRKEAISSVQRAIQLGLTLGQAKAEPALKGVVIDYKKGKLVAP